jgi:hypothetical protein
MRGARRLMRDEAPLIIDAIIDAVFADAATCRCRRRQAFTLIFFAADFAAAIFSPLSPYSFRR